MRSQANAEGVCVWGSGGDILTCFMVVGISSDVPRLRMIAQGLLLLEESRVHQLPVMLASMPVYILIKLAFSFVKATIELLFLMTCRLLV